jgi:hypothetical protein
LIVVGHASPDEMACQKSGIENHKETAAGLAAAINQENSFQDC